jgi:hypothetical protein
MAVRFVRSRMVTVIDPDTQIAAGLEQFVILTRVTFLMRKRSAHAKGPTREDLVHA